MCITIAQVRRAVCEERLNLQISFLANLFGVHMLGCMGKAVEELTHRCLVVAAHAATRAAP